MTAVGIKADAVGLVGMADEILHVVAAVVAEHDGHRHAVVKIGAGIVGVGPVGILPAGLLRRDPDVQDHGVFQDLGMRNRIDTDGDRLVFGRFIDAYNRVCALERDQARALVRASAAVEALVRTPPSCAEASFEVNGVQVEVRRVPGVKPLAWVWGSASAVHDVQLRRLVRCKRR